MREAVISTPGRIQAGGADPGYLLSAACVPMRTNHLSRVMPAQRHPAGKTAGTPSSRASTSLLRRLSKQDVDGRDKPGHDSD